MMRINIDNAGRDIVEGHRDSPGSLDLLHGHQVFHICGAPEFCQADANAIKQAGLVAFRPPVHTTTDLEQELFRQRLNRAVIPYWHVSAHASPVGIQIGSLTIGPQWWLDSLSPADDLEIILLATCENVTTSDLLVGMARHVVSIYEPVRTSLAAMFSLAFWTEFARTGDAAKAFDRAIAVVPQVSHCTRLRSLA